MADMVWRPAFHDVDPEREVVLEEIAMYEDDPQDTVFDVLGEAVFGDHPLGRPIIGRAPVIRDTPVDVIAAFHARRYVPRLGRDRRGRLGRPRRRSSSWPSARSAAARRGEPRRRPSPRRREPRRDRALPAQGHRAGPRLPRRPRAAARRRAPLRGCACSTRSSAGCPPRGCSRPCARSAGSPTRSTRSPASTPTPARSASTSARGRTTSREAMEVVGDELDRAARASPRPRRSSCARARTSRRASCSAWSPPARG